jgi:hypothetical protein
VSQHAITQVVDRGLIGLNDVCKGFIASVFSLEYPGFFFVHVTPLNFLYLLYAIKEKRLQNSLPKSGGFGEGRGGA